MTNRQPLIETVNLHRKFVVERSFWSRPVRWLNAVQDASLRIFAGETVGLVGESGCGKTTLGRLILRLLPPSSGKIFFRGQDITKSNASQLRNLRRDMQVIFQDPFSSLNPRLTVADIITEGMLEHGLIQPADRQEHARRLLSQVGLDPIYTTRYPHEFSGGQRQRIGIARAIALNPSFIVCDEAISALDVSVQAQIIQILMNLKNELNLSYLFIAHDLAVIRNIADRVVVMYLGQIVEAGPTDEVFSAPQHPYTRALLSSIPIPDPSQRHQREILRNEPVVPAAGCLFHPRCPVAEERCKSGRSPDSTQITPSHSASCHLL